MASSKVPMHLQQIKELINRIDKEEGSTKFYDFLMSISQTKKNELWELCNKIQSNLITEPFRLIQKQIESTEKDD